MKINLIIFTFLLLSCVNKATSDTNNQSNSTEMNSQTEGFTEMTILESKNTSCRFLLKDDNNSLYEVENIATKIPDIQTKNKIWIKFTPLRKMSVCDAQPISIDEIYQEK